MLYRGIQRHFNGRLREEKLDVTPVKFTLVYTGVNMYELIRVCMCVCVCLCMYVYMCECMCAKKSNDMIRVISSRKHVHVGKSIDRIEKSN